MWFSETVLTILSGRQAPARERLPLTALTRRDAVWAAATGGVSAILFATTLTAHVGLGDAPETVSGVMSLGILHAPGYPSYVIAARLFTLLEPLGSPALRVNLFSLVCAALTVAGVQLLARRCGAARWAASLGALTLAAGAGFWFYADFAKHDIFSGLLFLIALHLAVALPARPTTRRLIALGAVTALGLGSSWPLMLLLMPAVAVSLFLARGGISLRGLAGALGTGLLVLVLVYGFVLVRAGENPAINWGGATSLSRLVALVDRADFLPHQTSPTPAAAHASSAAGGGAAGAPVSTSGSATSPAGVVTPPGAVTSRVANYGFEFARELGVVALLLAAVGIISRLRRRLDYATVILLVALAGNLLGAGVAVGPSGAGSYSGDLIQEGFILGCYFVLATWVALGATAVVAAVGRLGPSGRLSSARRPIAVTALAAVVLVPLLVGHWPVARRASAPYADRYAAAVFSELPPRAAIFVFGAELSQPLVYRQVIDHQRRDVVVVAADGLPNPWYREQVSRRLGFSLPPVSGNSGQDVLDAVAAVRRTRPVYLDPQAAAGFGIRLGYRPVGLVQQLADGQGPAPVASPSALEQTVLAAERAAGLPSQAWTQWPNDYVDRAEYAAAGQEVARAYYEHRDFTGMRRALENVLSVDPGQPNATQDLAQLNGQS